MPDDPNDDFESAPPTVADAVPIAEAPEPVTRPHQVLARDVDRAFESGREQGCKTCYQEAQDEAVAAFEVVFRSKGLTEDEIAAVVATARALMTAP